MTQSKSNLAKGGKGNTNITLIALRGIPRPEKKVSGLVLQGTIKCEFRIHPLGKQSQTENLSIGKRKAAVKFNVVGLGSGAERYTGIKLGGCSAQLKRFFGKGL